MEDSIQTFKSMAPSAFRKQRVSGLECRMAPSWTISSQLLSHISEGHPVDPILGIFDSSPTFTSPSPPVTMFCQLLNLGKTLFRCYSQNYSKSCPAGFPVPSLLYATETHRILAGHYLDQTRGHLKSRPRSLQLCLQIQLFSKLYQMIHHLPHIYFIQL